jgi:hypothetical protein
MNCQKIGPSLSPSSTSPCETKRRIDSPPSASIFRLVQKREALTVKTKPSGVVFAQPSKVAGLKVE